MKTVEELYSYVLNKIRQYAELRELYGDKNDIVILHQERLNGIIALFEYASGQTIAHYMRSH